MTIADVRAGAAGIDAAATASAETLRSEPCAAVLAVSEFGAFFFDRAVVPEADAALPDRRGVGFEGTAFRFPAINPILAG